MYTELITSGASAENAVANKLYNCVYKTVARINQLLDALDNLRGTASDTDIESIRAELLCIRAFCYDQACQHYGDLPYVVHTAGINDSQTPRTPRETIVENLMQTASETGLPPRELDQTVEKIRTALKRTITRMYCTDGCMKVITLECPAGTGNGRVLVKRGKWLISGIKPGNAPACHPATGRADKKVQWFITEPGDPDFTGYADSFLPSGRTLLS